MTFPEWWEQLNASNQLRYYGEKRMDERDMNIARAAWYAALDQAIQQMYRLPLPPPRADVVPEVIAHG